MGIFLKHRLRLVAAVLLVSCFGGVTFLVTQSFSTVAYEVTPNVDLRGTWQFHNGDLKANDWIDTSKFPLKVEVPKQLPKEIRRELKSAFWYRRGISIPAQFRKGDQEYALSLGSIKGAYKVYWNGNLLGSAPTTTWEIFRVPAVFLKSSSAVITVRVEKSSTLFEGIVHFTPMDLAPALKLAGITNQYYYETSVRPLIAGIFKFVFFLLFMVFFLAAPIKRELFSFAIFSLLSATSAVVFSRAMPFYDDYYFKNAMAFFFNSLSLAVIPFFTSDMLRLNEKSRSRLRAYGFLVTAAAFAYCQFSRGEEVLASYALVDDWLPIVVSVPCVVLALIGQNGLHVSLGSRKFQIRAFAFFMALNLLAESAFISTVLNYQSVFYHSFIDLLLFAGLGATLALDFQVTTRRSDAVKKMAPKWFAAFISSGIQNVKLELPLIVLAVDTVGYSKALAGMNGAEKDKFHERLRAALLPLVTQFQAQKISERGDGGIFAWDYHSQGTERGKNLKLALAAARYLAECGTEDTLKIQFRQGMAAGLVRGEMNGPDLSFLGDALVCACRLEPIAQPGTVLVDESLAQDYEGDLAKEWTEAKIKGVLYRARPLYKVA